MLALGVRFLADRYYACDFRDRSKPEWPPHPDRLFSALVAACHLDDSNADREALMWLERQDPPCLAVPRSQEIGDGRAIYTMVPVNDERTNKIRLLPENRGRQPRYFPSVAVSEPVYVIWKDADPNDRILSAIRRISSRVTYLGGSMSLVQVWVEPTPPEPTLAPDPSGSETLRVPALGRLVELEERYRSNLRPSLGRQVRYRWVSGPQAVEDEPHPSPFPAAYVLARRSGPAPALEATLTITESLRRSLMSLAGEEAGKSLPALLHGHGNTGFPHCAFVSLPFVGSAYADGRLLGIAVLFPKEASDQERREILRLLGKLQHLDTPAGRIWLEPVARLRPQQVPLGLTLERWRGSRKGETTWVSITPVLFDRFPKPSQGGVLGAVVRLAENAGLPRPVKVKTVRFPPVAGVPPAYQFRVRRTSKDPTRYVTHLIITFSKPVTGPVLMGAGRYFGLGMFIPFRDSTWTEARGVEPEL